MVGKTVRSRFMPSGVATLFGLVALPVFALAAVFANVPLAVVGVAILLLAVVLATTRMPAVVFELTRRGIEVERPTAEFIPYDTIRTLRPFGRSHDFAKPGEDHFILNVVHEAGVLSLPARLSVSSEDLLQFLDRQLADRADQLPPPLGKHYDKQVARYGEDKVTAYAAREHLGYLTSYPRWRVALGVTLAFWVLIAAGIAMLSGTDPNLAQVGVAFVSAGCLMWAVIGLILFAVWGTQANGSVRAIAKWRKSGLVISPEGIGLVQGDMKGEMEWEEIRDVKLDVKRLSGLVIHVEGARILIADIYTAPLSHILHKIRDNWREDVGDDD